MSYLADDTAAINARMEEIKADRRLAQTGSTAEEKPAEKPQEFDSYGMYVVGYKSQAHPEWPYTGTAHAWRGFVKE
jgi:hypothetical protein